MLDYPPFADGDGDVDPYGFEPVGVQRVGPFPAAESPAQPDDDIAPYGNVEGTNEDHQLSYTDAAPSSPGDADRTTQDAPAGRGPTGEGCNPYEAGLGVDGSPWKGSPVTATAPDNHSRPY